jgi:hypothetical protein
MNYIYVNGLIKDTFIYICLYIYILIIFYIYICVYIIDE